MHKKVLNELLKPRSWKAPEDRRFMLNADEIGELCDNAEKIFRDEPTVLQVSKVVGALATGAASMWETAVVWTTCRLWPA